MTTRSKQAGRQFTAGRYTYLILAIATIIAVFPLYYTMIIASHTNHEMAQVPPPFLPNSSMFHNIRLALHEQPLLKAVVNSLIVSGSTAIGTVSFCTLSGFAFAKLRFRGSRALLGLTIATMAIPPQLGVIPLFLLIAKLHWVNHLQSVVLPTLVSAFGVFFMRQYLLNAVPTEILEAGLGRRCVDLPHFPVDRRSDCPPGDGGLGHVVVPRILERLLLAVDRLDQPQSHGPGRSRRTRIGLHPTAGSHHGRHAARDISRSCRIRAAGTPDCRRHHARSGKGMTQIDAAQDSTAESSALRVSQRFRMGNSDRGLPDRRRCDRRWPNAVDLGHV